MRALFLVAMISLALSLALAVAGFLGVSSQPVDAGTWGAVVIEGEVAVYRDKIILGSMPLEVLSIPCAMPSAAWAMLEWRQRRQRVMAST